MSILQIWDANTKVVSDRIKELNFNLFDITFYNNSQLLAHLALILMKNTCNLISRSQPNMRQLSSSGTYLESMKSMKSIDRDATSNTISRMAVSQSAPHTPVSAPSHEGPIFKSVPRLLSEPIVNRSKSCSPSTKTSRLERRTSASNDTRIEEHVGDDMNESRVSWTGKGRVLRNNLVTYERKIKKIWNLIAPQRIYISTHLNTCFDIIS